MDGWMGHNNLIDKFGPNASYRIVRQIPLSTHDKSTQTTTVMESKSVQADFSSTHVSSSSCKTVHSETSSTVPVCLSKHTNSSTLPTADLTPCRLPWLQIQDATNTLFPFKPSTDGSAIK